MVPLEDIRLFLKLKGVETQDQEDEKGMKEYAEAWKIIQANLAQPIPIITIEAFVRAHLLVQDDIYVPFYRTEEIMNSSYKDLTDLVEILALPMVNKPQILNILSYLGVLDISFAHHPENNQTRRLVSNNGDTTLLLRKNGIIRTLQLGGNRFSKSRDFSAGLVASKIQDLSSSISHCLIAETSGELSVLDFSLNTLTKKQLPNPQDQTITKIAGGYGFSLVLTTTGRVYGLGCNHRGQLGRSNLLDSSNFSKMNLRKAIDLSAGLAHSLILNDEGQVFSCGDNTFSQLGHGDTEERLQPVLIKGLNQIIKVAAGSDHSLVLDEKGIIYSFGANDVGQLGLPETVKSQATPTLIPALRKIVGIAAGYRYSLALTIKGRVWGFGNNSKGQLMISGLNCCFLPRLLNSLFNIVEVAAGASQSSAVDNWGRVLVFGNYRVVDMEVR
jgi:hypothetical protein